MITTKQLVLTFLSTSSAAIAHPISQDSLIPALVHSPVLKPVSNADVIPAAMIESALMGSREAAALVRDPLVVTAQKSMLNQMGFSSGDCGMILIKTGRNGKSSAMMIAQSFNVAAGKSGLVIQTLNAAAGSADEKADIGKWLNAYDYEYRLSTQTMRVSGILVDIGIGKFKACP